MSTLSPSFEEFLPAWVARQRWYRGKTAGSPRLRRIGSIRWEDPLGEVGLEDHLVVDESGQEPVIYQVPLSYRAEAVDFMADGLVATAEHDELGTRYIYDATHDPVFAQVLLQQMYAEADVPSARARRIVAGGSAPALRTSRVLSGEQSNTSIVVEAHGETRPVIIKVFRVLQPGDNPDVTVPTAITLAGSRQVPGPIGYVEGRWSSPDGEEASGHLAFAQEFLPETQDAWVGALQACRTDEDFTGHARELGAATADVHAALRRAFGTSTPDGEGRATLVDRMRRRAQEAFADVPELAAHQQAVEAVYAELESHDLPDLQRVHGDYHLGQVLRVPGRGWVLVDFEGEPLRPLADRNAPDLVLRDVAGMLRSFDYAAASVRLAGEGEHEDWARSAREAFLQGYAEVSGEDLSASGARLLLDALELDKALYEASYEARNRPDWVPIPVSAVSRLTGALTAAPQDAPQGRHRIADTSVPPAQGEDDLPVGAAGGQARDREDGAGDPAVDAAAAGAVSADHAVRTGAAEGGETSVDLPPAPGNASPDEAPQHGDTSSPSQSPSADSDQPVTTDGGVNVDAAVDADAGADAKESEQLVPRGVRASGGVPHAPVPPPREMLLTLDDLPGRSPGALRETELETPRTLSASGWSGRVSDPEQARTVAWEEATSSPEIVTGGIELPGVDGPQAQSARGGGPVAPGRPGGDGPARTVRTPLAAPVEPSPPHSRPLDLEEATDVVHGMHRNPHALLGAHEHEGHVTIRTLQPEADEVTVLLPGGRTVPMSHETGGIWVAVLPGQDVPAYRLHVATGGRRHVLDEAYRHGPSLGATDLHLIGEGRHEELWRALGAHVITVRDELGEVTGTRFAVWAPNAIAVHVIGDFNGWNGATHALRAHDDVGVWELFVPGVREGAHYKYDITGPDGVRRAKADPMARASEVPPFNNSVVTVSRHRWSHGDAEWMAARRAGDVHHGPMSIYEVHLGSWKQGLGYEELADELVDHVSSLGFTHVEFMPVMQHPYGGSWGYHVTGYFAADSRFGHEDGLRYLIDRLHSAGVGVILDWVPGHFATDPWALARFDGTPIYEHPDPRKGWHPEWGSYIFDYGRPEVRNFLVANATYWLEEFHADGLRVDGVASMLYLDYSRQAGQWLPNQHGGRENLEAVALLQEANATAYRRNPGVVMIAEESTSWPGVTASTDEGGLGFGFKWNMGWMHDTLDYVGESVWARGHHHQALTFSIVYAFGEKYILPVSHDEVVHGKGSLVRKMSGDAWAKFGTTRAFLAYQWTHPGKQLLFMGSEFAQVREWAEEGSLSWELLQRPEHAGVQTLVRDLNRIYRDTPALWEIDHHADGFTWLDANDASRNIYSYLRWGNEDEDGLRPVVAVLVNFSGTTHTVHTGLPYGGRWREVLNTDAEVYAGAGVGNMGGVDTVDHPHQRQPWSAMVTVPAYGAVVLEPESVHQADWGLEVQEDDAEEPDGEQDTTRVLEAGAGATAGVLTVGASEDVAGALPEAPSTERPTAAAPADPGDGSTTEPTDLGDGSTTELAHGDLPSDHPFVTEGGQPIDHAEGESVDLDGTGDPSAEGVAASAPVSADDEEAFLTFGVTPEQDHDLEEPAEEDDSEGDRPAGATDRGSDPS